MKLFQQLTLSIAIHFSLKKFNFPYYLSILTGIFKRGGLQPYPFPCNGYDNLPRCLHGGKGPRKTRTKAGRFCVCLCPAKWIGAECAYASDFTIGKRSNMIGGDMAQWMPAQPMENEIRKPLPWVSQYYNVEEPKPALSRFEQQVVRRNDPFYTYSNNDGKDAYYSMYDGKR